MIRFKKKVLQKNPRTLRKKPMLKLLEDGSLFLRTKKNLMQIIEEKIKPKKSRTKFKYSLNEVRRKDLYSYCKIHKELVDNIDLDPECELLRPLENTM